MNNKNDEVVCVICGYCTTNHQSFNSHITHAHKIKSKDYYDTYIKSENDGKCKTCGKPTNFFNMWHGYRQFCSDSCMSSNKDIQDKRKQTSLKHYGVEFPHSSQEIKDKTANTCLEKYGATNLYASQYGKQKIRETLLSRYGVENITQNHEARCKMAKSRRKNGNHSSIEDYFEKQLISKNIKFKKQYDQDDRYPYPCDFYLVDSDTFIEINNYWVHHTHFFDENNKDDLNLLQIWKNKNSDHYKRAINIWTVIDIAKKKCAETNKLNYVVLWNKQDIENYLSTL